MEWIKGHLPELALIIAVVALLQHWVIGLLKYIMYPGKIDIYETGNLEVGYSELGPTVGLTGTLRAVGTDLFIRRIKLVVKRESDNKHFEFEWDVFRDRKITVGTEHQSEMLPPSGFTLMKVSPKPINIQFHDVGQLNEMRQVFFDVHKAWQEMIAGLGKDELEKLNNEVSKIPDELRDPYRPLYEKFVEEEIYQEAKAKLEELCYWQPGDYAVKLVVQTATPSKSFEKGTDFALSAKDVEAIKFNVDRILADVMNRPSGLNYFFAYPKYKNLSLG